MRGNGLAYVWRVAAALGGVGLAGCAPDTSSPPGSAVALERVAGGFTAPVDLQQPRGESERLFVVDQVGVIWIVRNDQRADEPFLDLRERIVELSPTYDERGLLGLAFHPDYATNRRFFVTYNAPLGEDAPAGFDSELRLSEFLASNDEDAADPDSERVLLRIYKPQYNHNGGQIAFGPDGLLYVSVGDGGGGNDEGPGHNPEIGNGQDRTTLLGKLLRIDVDTGEESYAIPNDNPFVGQEDVLPEIWAWGLRNPWRFSFDQGGDQRLFLADAGQDLFEEVNIIERGRNYGWRIREGAACFDPDDAGSPPRDCPDIGADGEPLMPPILQFGHTDARGFPTGTVVIGGYVYRGSGVPALQGQYLFGDFTVLSAAPLGQLYAAREADDGSWSWQRLLVTDGPGGSIGRYVLAFGQDQAGEIYVLTSGHLGPVGSAGEVYRLEAAR